MYQRMRNLVFLAIFCTLTMSLGPLEKMGYIFSQAFYGLKLLMNRMKVEDVIADKTLGPKYAERLRELSRIQEFARSYGLNTDTYHHMIFPPGDPEVVSYLVTASHRLSLTPVEEWFPFVGRMEYLGFFKKSDRDAKSKELSATYDVVHSRAGGFSLLGYIDDPIFPSMLTGERWVMAELFFHELVHATIWIKNAMRFNEGLAGFISEKLTDSYLEHHGDRDQISHRRIYVKEFVAYKKWLGELESALEGLYESELSAEEKTQQKAVIFQRFTSHKPEYKRYDFVGKPERWNNAKVIISKVYSQDNQIFERVLACSSELSVEKQLMEMVETLKSHKIKKRTIEDILAQVCQLMRSAGAESKSTDRRG